jgi:hypothetical protein
MVRLDLCFPTGIQYIQYLCSMTSLSAGLSAGVTRKELAHLGSVARHHICMESCYMPIVARSQGTQRSSGVACANHCPQRGCHRVVSGKGILRITMNNSQLLLSRFVLIPASSLGSPLSTESLSHWDRTWTRICLHQTQAEMEDLHSDSSTGAKLQSCHPCQSLGVQTKSMSTGF